MGHLRTYIEHVSDSFQTLFNLDAVPHLSEAENVDRVIGQTATVAWCVYCMVPFPVLDVATLTPIQAKMAVHIARLKGFEVTPERGKETVLEIVGVLGMTLTAQMMISSTAKLVPILGTVVGGPLVYAATHAIGNVVDYYYDCLRRDQTPSNEAMKDLFVEQFRVGKAKGEQVDRSEIQKKADELRRRVAERDPSLATETRLPPREESLRRAPATAAPPPASEADGGRRKIKITLGAKTTGAAGKSASSSEGEEELATPVRKTIGPTGHVGPEARPAKSLGPDPAPAAKSLGAEPPPAKSLGAEPAPAAKSLGAEPPPAKSLAPDEPLPAPTPNAISHWEDERLSAAPTPPRGVTPPAEAPSAEAKAPAETSSPAPAEGKGSIVDQLERLGRLKAQGVLSADEFDQAKRKILGL